MEKWEKKFELTPDIRERNIVLADYARERTFRLIFQTEKEAQIFVSEFRNAQLELEINGELKTKVTVIGNVNKQIIKFSFGDRLGNALELECEFDSQDELVAFQNKMRVQITKYSVN